jgi:hypothetical protein
VPVATIEVVESLSSATRERAQNASLSTVDYEVHPAIMAADGGLPFTLFVAVTLKPFETRAVIVRRTSAYNYQYLDGMSSLKFGLPFTRTRRMQKSQGLSVVMWFPRLQG